MRRTFPCIIGVFCFVGPALAAVECDGYITISKASDAKELREACKVIEGDISIAEELTDAINLDGVEEILGDITHYGCGLLPYEACSDLPKSPISFSSLTLRTINGSLEFLTYRRLERVSLPKLSFVLGSVSFRDVPTLKEIDLTNLETVNEFILETPKLEKLKLNGIKGFNQETSFTGGVEIWDSGLLDNVDAFFREPINTTELDSWRDGKTLLFNPSSMPNVREITLGWTGIDTLDIAGDNLTVILGGSNTADMSIKKVIARKGVTKIARGKNTDTLTVGSFSLIDNEEMPHLNMPFDGLASMSLINSSLESVSLPPGAQNWNNMTLTIKDCANLALESENSNDGQMAWVWPDEEMSSINITSSVSNEFFDTFIRNKVKVTDTFSILDESGNLDCSIFGNGGESNNTLPSGFECAHEENFGARLAQSQWSTLIAFTLFLGVHCVA